MLIDCVPKRLAIGIPLLVLRLSIEIPKQAVMNEATRNIARFSLLVCETLLASL